MHTSFPKNGNARVANHIWSIVPPHTHTPSTPTHTPKNTHTGDFNINGAIRKAKSAHATCIMAPHNVDAGQLQCSFSANSYPEREFCFFSDRIVWQDSEACTSPCGLEHSHNLQHAFLLHTTFLSINKLISNHCVCLISLIFGTNPSRKTFNSMHWDCIQLWSK